MKRYIPILTIVLVALTLSMEAASCKMERLNARIYHSEDSWTEICKEKGGCKKGQDDKGRTGYIKTYRDGVTHFGGLCEKLKKDETNATLQKEFFLYFPSNSYMYKSYFGYDIVGVETLEDGERVYAPLHKEGFACIELFFKLNTIQKECVYEKAIGIVQDANLYGSGSIDDFADFLDSAMYDDIKSFVEVLSKRSEKEQRDFWYLHFNLYDVPLSLNEGL
jgi:hypothetical protein